MISSTKKRLLLASGFLALGFTGFSYRLVDLQVSQYQHFVDRAAENHDFHEAIHARRGAILDVNAQPLAQNDPVRTVVADGSLVKDAAQLASLLSGPLGLSEEILLEKLSHTCWSEKERKVVPVRYIVLKHALPEAAAEDLTRRLAEAKIHAITLEPDSVRVYPNGETLCHVLGFVDNRNVGVDGVEKTMEQYLHGQDGVRFTERDGSGKELVPYRSEERPATNGSTVHLTIDLALQDIVESELHSVCAKYKPNGAVGIIMRPTTGEILALANCPNFNLSTVKESQGASVSVRRNRAISDMFEPGSTFKIVVMSAALNERLVTMDTVIPVENGYFTYMGRVLRDTHCFPELTVHDILVHSSNIGAAKLGIQLGSQRLFEYIHLFGFGDRTLVALPGEIGGLVHPLHNWNKLSISRIPMGQEVCVTPLQIASAMSVIANGGNLMVPQIIHDVVDNEGGVTPFPPTKVRTVISSRVAEDMRSALVDVMGKKGTGKDICVRGFQAGGKTGTAQKTVEGKAGYEKGKYVLSFVGFVPAKDPQFVCLVLLDGPNVEDKTKNYGGSIAGPVFARIAERTAEHLGLQPSKELLAEQLKTIAQAENREHD